MPTSRFLKPLLPSHYSIWFEPPDESGDEVLHLVSERRSLKLKGQSFREFHQLVIPLLDGRHTVTEIRTATAGQFQEDELIECLNFLGEQAVLVEGDGEVSETARLAPQLNFLREMGLGSETQARLAAATVAVIGLGGTGAATALALAAAGVGTLRCIDSLPVAVTDVYRSPFLSLAQVGHPRAAAVVSAVAASAPEVFAAANESPLESEDDVRAAVAGADFVVCCLDAGQSNLIFKLNRVCLADGIRWIACSPSGAEVTIGPAIHPGESACYLCYRMRVVACAGNPEDAFAYEKYLDRRRHDDGDRRESLVFAIGIAANLLGLEVLKELTGLAEPSLVGRILTVKLTDLAIARHTVLRKPWCPACFPREEPPDRG
jgi:adenylyltransferase/sulfurtransferase